MICWPRPESPVCRPRISDEAVHELTSSIAADVNNEGLERQLGYLIDQLGSQEAGKAA